LTDIAAGGLEVDSEGFIYSADFGASASQPGSTIVRVHPLSGKVDTLAMGFPLRGMTGNTIDDEGNFFQSNYRGGTVSKIDTAGNVTTFASTNIAGPVGLAFDEFDTL
jgi:sugar lactone lactonase YvrE